MKTIHYILSLGILFSLCFLIFSCADEIETRRDGNWCDGKTLLISLNAPVNEVISPMTKSTQADTTFTDLNVLVYDESGLKVFYYSDSKDKSFLDELRTGTEKQLALDLGESAKGIVYAIANYGHQIDLNNPTDKEIFSTSAALENAKFTLDGIQPKLYMYANGLSFDVSDATMNKVKLELERIYAMVTVQIVKQLQQPSGAGASFDIIPTSVQIKHIPDQGQLMEKNKIGANGVECEIDGEKFEGDLSFLYNGHNSAPAFYMYENRQPDGSSLNNNQDQKTKTPYGLPADEITSIIKQNRTCSYIEVHGKYVRNNNETGVGSGTIIYRFFLGKDIYKNFDIMRNAHYQVTLTLNGKGGADEATWRVETKLYGEIQAPDVYLGYRAGSKTKMYVTGDVNYVKSVTIKTLSDPTNNGNQEQFIVSPALKDDVDGRKYVEIEGIFTNIHDYSKKVGEVTFLLEGNGIKKEQRAKVYQVPRLVDPIAFYKSASNDSLVHVVVRAYNPETRQYEPLESKGPWSVEIETVGKGANWFTISSNDDSQKAQRVNEVVTGEGIVSFKYKPDSKLSSEDKKDLAVMDGARFGKLVVKYHNDWCPHEIYLRQGYNPTRMGDENYAWSMFNCLGKKALTDREVGAVTDFPTQTGWLFNGGIDIAMHPFNPGYNQALQDLNYSDGDSHPFGYKASSSNNNWGEKIEPSMYVDKVKWGGKQGPCPEGYVVPTSQTYRNVTESSTVYTGFVYDEDNVSGWFYNPAKGGDADIDATNHCNPAKGSLFISNNDGCTNIFFNYGKGVLTAKKNNDPKLIAEIGVGHRYSGGKLIYSEASPQYGAYYWSGTVFEMGVTSWGRDNTIDPNGNKRSFSHMGKVDFGYDVFSKEPTLIDVPGQYSALDQRDIAIGIDASVNGSFVRCVRPQNMVIVEYESITIKGTFYDKFPGLDRIPRSTLLYVYDMKNNHIKKQVLNFKDGVIVENATSSATIQIPKGSSALKFSSGGGMATVSVADLTSGRDIELMW